MKSDKVKVEGNRVVGVFDSEASARQAATAIDRDRVKLEGSHAEKMDKAFDWIGDLTDGLNRPSMGILSWVLAFVASWLTFVSFERMTPVAEIDVGFGIVGICFIFAQKIGAARWAKADNLNSAGGRKLANFYLWMTFGAMAIVLTFGVAFQAAVSDDQAAGVVSIEGKVEREDRAIRELQYKAEEMVRPQDEQAVLKEDIDRALKRPARNAKGDPAGFTIGEAIGAGAPGKQPATFCMPSKATQFYIDKECPDLIDMEKDLRRRVAYDAAIAEIAKRSVANEDARKHMPKKASGLALGEKIAGSGGKIWGFILSALLLAFIDAGMVFCSYISKRHPKGVNEAQALLSEKAAPAPAAAAAGT